jgi:hypothetical protein
MPKQKRIRGRTIDELLAAVGKGAFDYNVARVEVLAEIYDSLPTAVKKRRAGGGADVLRAGVVLLHANLEDLLRRIARFRIPDGNDEALRQIPLVGCAPREKFTLGELARFRDKSVSDVLHDSVREYYDSFVTFNSVGDIVGVLERSAIKQDRVKKLYPELAQMIARRHEIVHRADIIDSSTQQTQPLSVGKLRSWIGVTRRFGKGVLVELSGVRPVDLAAHVDYLFGDGPPPKH